MNDSQTLHDAFAELERQADLVSGSRAATAPRQRPARSTGGNRRLQLIGATVVAVLAVAVVIALLVPQDGGRSRPAIGGPAPSADTETSSAAPATSSSSAAPHSPAATSTSVVPKNRKAMIKAFARVLGPGVKFTVTGSQGNYIKGVLTVAKTGHRGGYDIQAYQGKPGDRAICEDADTSHCKVSRTSRGGSLSTGHEPAADGSGTLYLVDYVRPDGASFLMHLSTVADPKGGGAVLGSKPPLTLKQVVAVVESDRW